MDTLIIYTGKYGYVLALVLLLIKAVHFRLNGNWSPLKFIFFGPNTIAFSKTKKRKTFKRLQNVFSLLILFLLIAALFINTVILAKPPINTGVEVPGPGN